MRNQLLVLAGALMLVGCSASEPDRTGTNNGASNNGTSNNGQTNNGQTNNGTANNGQTNNGTSNNSAGPCPSDAPSADETCTVEGLTCEWGTDPREQCRTRGTCTGGTWTTTGSTCDPLPDVTCPATREEAAGTACEPMNAICEYPDGLTCLCTNCTVGGPVEMCGGDPDWKCKAPNSDPECPAAKPRLGATCSDAGKTCTYECGPENGRTCEGGVWTADDGGPCPVSTATLKTNVRYLSSAELAQISERLQSMRLARWEYTDASLGKGDRLGFIIEDLPADTPAVDRDRMMVDLYGYASMLVADAQAREAEIKELKQRLEAVEAKLAADD